MKKLNLPCERCGKEITLGEGSIIDRRPLHYECFEEEKRRSRTKRWRW